MLKFLGYDNYNTLFKDAIKLIAVASIAGFFSYMMLPSFTKADWKQDQKDILTEMGITKKEDTN